jgi:hypothetical protein
MHMSVILMATASSGVLASKLLLSAGIENLAIRYPLSVVLAYLVFFLCIKLWLVYVTPQKKAGGAQSSELLDFIDIPVSDGGGAPSFQPGGGRFGGGGASDSFEIPVVGINDNGGVVGEAASHVAEGAGSAIGKAADAVGDDDGVPVMVALALLAALVAVILGSAIFLIYNAPVILSETAFQGVLAASLVKSTKKISSEEWVGSIFSATWKPFLVTCIMALVAGCLLHYYFPGATKIMEILKKGLTMQGFGITDNLR